MAVTAFGRGVGQEIILVIGRGNGTIARGQQVQYVLRVTNQGQVIYDDIPFTQHMERVISPLLEKIQWQDFKLELVPIHSRKN